ncbi:hypothetical protein DFH11DRAFT_1594400 [Phellopilus nigrolimitatus]|nr:hypothetical protein DFH11DRAFT_1594400 [Phellopilus nigrolimitatus]
MARRVLRLPRQFLALQPPLERVLLLIPAHHQLSVLVAPHRLRGAAARPPIVQPLRVRRPQRPRICPRIRPPRPLSPRGRRVWQHRIVNLRIRVLVPLLHALWYLSTSCSLLSPCWLSYFSFESHIPSVRFSFLLTLFARIYGGYDLSWVYGPSHLHPHERNFLL